MPFVNRDMSVIAYANGFTLWQYYGQLVLMDTVAKDGFFDKVKSLMMVGDKIMCVCKDGYIELIVASLKDGVKTVEFGKVEFKDEK